MTILLADNEKMIRLGLHSMLEEIDSRYHYLEAKNGLEMIEQAEAGQPDIAFIDIRMPLMDGLSALGPAMQKSPHTQWVILSGYADFEYAQTAIRHGVSDYLLKPVDIQQLRSVMAKLEQALDQQRQQQNKLFEAQVIEAFNSDLPELVDTRYKAFGISLHFFDQPQKAVQAGVRQRGDSLLAARLCQQVAGRCSSARFFLPTGQYAVLVAAENPPGPLYRAEDFAQRDMTVIQAEAESFDSLYKKLSLLLDYGSLRCLHRYGRLTVVDGSDLPAGLRTMLPLAKMLERFCLLHMQRDRFGCEALILKMKESPPLEEGFKKADIDSLARYLFTAVGIDIDGAATCTGLADRLEAACRGLQGKSAQPGREAAAEMMEEIRHYIALHYMEGIGLDTVGDAFDLSPFYLSRIFHQQSGTSFIDYLTEVRVQQAKRLLLELPGLPVKEVARKVGYYSAQHFSKVFGRKTGTSPLEYRKTNGQ